MIVLDPEDQEDGSAQESGGGPPGPEVSDPESEQIREDDVVARIGGDEFLVLMPVPDDPA